MDQVINKIFEDGKGILAADESTPTITKRFNSVNVPPTILNRHIYRHLIFSAPELENYVGGVILYDETIRNEETVAPLKDKGIVMGIKVDKGAVPFPCTSSSSKITQGLDHLATRLVEYKGLGAKFAKWRAVIDPKDSDSAIAANARNLALYAKICQSIDIVPIVEPEVLMEGCHNISTSFAVTSKVLRYVFRELARYDVELEHIILKPNMVVHGYESTYRNDPAQTAEQTLLCFRQSVPAAVPAIAFLSGGQKDEDAINNLAAMNEEFYLPWVMSFSFGRTLQRSALQRFAEGFPEKARRSLIATAERCSAATEGTPYSYEVPPIDFNN